MRPHFVSLALVRPFWGFCVVRFRYILRRPGWVSMKQHCNNHDRIHHQHETRKFNLCKTGESNRGPSHCRPSSVYQGHSRLLLIRGQAIRSVPKCVQRGVNLPWFSLKLQGPEKPCNDSKGAPCLWQNPSLCRQGRLMQVPSSLRMVPEYFLIVVSGILVCLKEGKRHPIYGCFEML